MSACPVGSDTPDGKLARGWVRAATVNRPLTGALARSAFVALLRVSGNAL